MYHPVVSFRFYSFLLFSIYCDLVQLFQDGVKYCEVVTVLAPASIKWTSSIVNQSYWDWYFCRSCLVGGVGWCFRFNSWSGCCGSGWTRVGRCYWARDAIRVVTSSAGSPARHEHSARGRYTKERVADTWKSMHGEALIITGTQYRLIRTLWSSNSHTTSTWEGRQGVQLVKRARKELPTHIKRSCGSQFKIQFMWGSVKGQVACRYFGLIVVVLVLIVFSSEFFLKWWSIVLLYVMDGSCQVTRNNYK